MSTNSNQLSLPGPNDTITFNVGGQLFTTRRSTLYRLPNSRLFDTLQLRGCDAIFFDRDPEIFRYVLDYYRTGELHLPHSSCAPFVRKEIIFWGIPEEDIEPCCLNFYMKYDEERQTKNALFKDCFEDIEPMQNLVRMSTGLRRLRYKTWLFLDYPTSSFAAKIWAFMLLLLVAISIVVYSLATHMNFRVDLQNLTDVRLLNATNATTTIFEDCLRHMSLPNASDNKHYRYLCTFPTLSIVVIDLTLNGIFTAELIFKAALAPDRRKFLRSGIILLEIIISTSFWLQIILRYYTSPFMSIDVYNQQLALRSYMTITDDTDDPIVMFLLVCCRMLQALRVFRVFKLSKISSGLRVLMLTVKTSITELLLLAFLLINGMFLFACLIYLAEYPVTDTFVDIPHALWWAIITITSVGYGDMYPKAGPGFFVGALCAISGCMVTGLAIPIIANNFNTYYKYMRNYLKESRYLKDRQNADTAEQRYGESASDTSHKRSNLLRSFTIARFEAKRNRSRTRGVGKTEDRSDLLTAAQHNKMMTPSTDEVSDNVLPPVDICTNDNQASRKASDLAADSDAHNQSQNFNGESCPNAHTESVPNNNHVNEKEQNQCQCHSVHQSDKNANGTGVTSMPLTSSPEHELRECNHHCLQHHAVPAETFTGFALPCRPPTNRKRIMHKLGMQFQTGPELNFL